jgi:hypothetical protein
VNGEILPYHLAIAVHHDSTDMADHPWMQREEEAFLNNPASVFAPSRYQVLREIRERIGLDYFGVDCGLDRSGNLVMFEANASMLVHDQNEGFSYKTPFVHRIKSAFDNMLRKCAAPAFLGQMARRSLPKSDDRRSRSRTTPQLCFFGRRRVLCLLSPQELQQCLALLLRRWFQAAIGQCGGRTMLDRGIPVLAQVKPDRLRAVIARLI